MKNRLLIIVSIAMFSVGWQAAFGQDQASTKAGAGKPQIVIFDIITTSYDPGKSHLLTDVFRAELFKTKLFNIIEKGVVQEVGASNKLPSADKADDSQLLQIGRAARGDKLFICSVEKFGSTIAIAARIVDVKTMFIDFTDNVFLTNEGQIFDAIKELATKIEFFYATDKKPSATNPQLALGERWKMLGAGEEEIVFLVENRIDTEEYLNIRQYDITFTPKQYVEILKSKIDPAIVKNFLQSGISFSQTQRALALGITKLDRFRDVFLRDNYTFEDYLEAYSHNIMSIEAYADYKKGFKQSYLNAGLGGVADQFPIANAAYKFGIAKISWERFWTSYQRDVVKFSTDGGLFFINMIAPTPFFQANVYFGTYPYYLKVGFGGHAEVILGGHFGAFAQVGFEIMETLDFSVIVVPFGTQPSISYTDLRSRPDDADYVKIVFPYAGAIVSYKVPISLF